MANIQRRPAWQLRESAVTAERFVLSRRRAVAGLLATSGLALTGCDDEGAGSSFDLEQAEPDPSAGLYPVGRNDSFELPQPWTSLELATGYNNFIEFGSHKSIQKAAQALPLRPWTVTVEGLVEKPITLDIDDLLRQMPLEERIYRHRCVETWSMVVPWSGFALHHLLNLARPLASARFVAFDTFNRPKIAAGQRAFWYPWPYTEGLTIEEASNELAFMATGLYGRPLPKQSGAPLRLAVPWKYGFKSIKSIERIRLVEEQPETLWNQVAGDEYGFWANVNPKVPHPRWSQAEERLLGTKTKVPTLLFNGYAEHVAHHYPNIMKTIWFR